MPNELKSYMIKELAARFRDTENYIVVGYKGIKARQFNKLKNDLRQNRICLQVIKNSIAKLALEETNKPEVASLLDGPSAIVTGSNDPVIMAKETVKWAEEEPFLTLRGGVLDSGVLSVDDIKNLAKLPSLPALRTQIAVSFNAPIVGVANAFSSVMRGLVTVFHAVKEQKEKNSG